MTGPRPALDGWRPIVGTVAEVAAAVRAARAAGRCEAMTRPESLSSGRVRVYIRAPGPGPTPARPPRRRWPLLTVVAVASAAVSVTVTVLAAAWALTVWRQMLGAGIVALALLVAWQRARR